MIKWNPTISKLMNSIDSSQKKSYKWASAWKDAQFRPFVKCKPRSQYTGVGRLHGRLLMQCWTCSLAGKKRSRWKPLWHLISSRMGIITKTMTAQRMVRKGDLYTLGKNLNHYGHHGKQYRESSQKLKWNHHIFDNSLSAYIFKWWSHDTKISLQFESQ